MKESIDYCIRYVIVEKPLSQGGTAYYKYNKSDGHLNWISKEDYNKENPQ